MPIQYLYPNGDKVTNNWASTEAPTYYTAVNNGTDFPNDIDIIYDNSGVLFNYQEGPTIQLYLDSFLYAPSSIDLIVRAQKVGNMPFNPNVYLCNPVIYNSGNEIIASGGDFFLFWNIPSQINKSGNLTIGNASYYDNPYLSFHVKKPFNSNINISEIQIEYSGDTYLTPNNNISLNIIGDSSVSGDSNLYTSGNYQTFGLISLHNIGHDENNLFTTLYTSGNFNKFGTIPLNINGPILQSNNIPLYINSNAPTGINNNSTLYTLGALDINDNIPLLIRSISSETLPLYINGFGGKPNQNITLYLDARDSGIDYGYQSNNTNLFIKSIPNISGDLFSLYIEAPSSGYIYQNLSLYLNNLNAWQKNQANTNLYLRALDSGNYTTSLFIKSFSSISGDPFNLYMSGSAATIKSLETLYVNGLQGWRENATLFLANATPINDNFNLYVKGTGNFELNYRTLFINGSVYNSNTSNTLFMSGSPIALVSGDLLNLYVNGGGVDERYNNLNLHLYAGGDKPYLNSIMLYMMGGFENVDMPLLLYNDYIPQTLTKSATLFTNGFSGVLGKIGQGCTFYIDGSTLKSNVNLYLHNNKINKDYGIYTLVVGGKDISYSGVSYGNTLYVHNESKHIDYGCDLLLNTQESYNYSGDFNLFISRSKEAVAGNINLYLPATNGITSQLETFISGSTTAKNNTSLSIPYVESMIISQGKLYTHGI